MIDELSVYFDNPARDSMGYEHVEGFLRCGRDHAELHFKERDRAFRKSDPQVATFDYGEIDGVEYLSGWFKPKILVLRTRSAEKLKNFPGADIGRVELQVIKKSRKDAEKAPAFLDYKHSEAYLRESANRLDDARDALDSGL